MPRQQQSPVDRFIGRFLQGLQVYRSFQDLEDQQKRTGLLQQQNDIARQDFEEKQRRQAELERFASGLEQPTTRTVQTPAAIPEQAPEGLLGSRSLSPELAMPSFSINETVGPTPEQKMQAAAARFGGSPAILEMLRQGARQGQGRSLNDPNVGPVYLDPSGNPHFPPRSTARTVGSVQVEAAEKLFPGDPVKQAEAIRDFQRNPEGAQGRVFEIISKGDKATAAERKIVSDYKNFLTESSGARASGQAQGREQGLQSVINSRLKRIEDESGAALKGRPLDQADRQAMGAMRQTLRVAAQIKDEFTPQEIDKYVGIFKLPTRRVAQLAAGDPKFARLQTLINTIKGTAFAEGGKQLTPFEASITFGHIPTGQEFSTVDFLSKLDTTVEQVTNLIEDRYNLATQPRGEGLPQSPGQKTAPVPTTNKKRLRFDAQGNVIP